MEGHNVNWIIDISQIASHLIVSQVSVGASTLLPLELQMDVTITYKILLHLISF